MIEEKYFIGIDIGTFSSKGVIINSKGEIIISSQTSHEMENPKQNYFEHDAEKVWWYDFCKISNELLNKSKIDKTKISGVGASTLGADCLPVDKKCNPLRKAILYGIDARCQAEIDEITQVYGNEKIDKLFGRPVCSGDVVAKILWIKNNEPEIYKNTYKFLTGSSYITAKLTDNYIIDSFLGIASFRPLYYTDGNINNDICKDFCLPEQLAQGKIVTEIAGYVTLKAEFETGIPAGTPVITGTGDSAAEAISVGVLEAGDMMIQLGSSVFIYLCTEQLIKDTRVRGNNFLIPETYSIAAGTNNCGTLLNWYKEQIFDIFTQEKNGRNVFEFLMDGIDKIPPGSDGLITLPYFAGERTPINNPKAKGVLFGLTLNHTKKHLYRSMLESIGYSIGQHIDIFKENNLKLNKIMIAGGGTKNTQWMQMISNIINEPLYLMKESIGASYGDALMAGIGTGHFKNFKELKSIIKIEKIFYPDIKVHKKYRKYRKIYDNLYSKTKTLMQ